MSTNVYVSVLYPISVCVCCFISFSLVLLYMCMLLIHPDLLKGRFVEFTRKIFSFWPDWIYYGEFKNEMRNVHTYEKVHRNKSTQIPYDLMFSYEQKSKVWGLLFSFLSFLKKKQSISQPHHVMILCIDMVTFEQIQSDAMRRRKEKSTKSTRKYMSNRNASISSGCCFIAPTKSHTGSSSSSASSAHWNSKCVLHSAISRY